jgi:hypothetical protein
MEAATTTAITHTPLQTSTQVIVQFVISLFVVCLCVFVISNHYSLPPSLSSYFTQQNEQRWLKLTSTFLPLVREGRFCCSSMEPPPPPLGRASLPMGINIPFVAHQEEYGDCQTNMDLTLLVLSLPAMLQPSLNWLACRLVC